MQETGEKSNFKKQFLIDHKLELLLSRAFSDAGADLWGFFFHGF